MGFKQKPTYSFLNKNKLNKSAYPPDLYLPKLYNEAKATLYFQNPVHRLVSRFHFETNNDALSKDVIDYFHIYEQVTLRGGFIAVDNQKRWQEVIKSMPFSHQRESELRDLYQKNLLAYEKNNYKDQIAELVSYKICVMFQPLRAFLNNPFPSKLRSNYLLEEEIQYVAQSKILHVDQYACFKVIVLSQKNKGSFLGILHQVGLSSLYKQIEQKTSPAIAEKLIQVFQFFLLNFGMDLNLYDNPYDKNIGFLQKLKLIAQNKSVAILGCSLRNYITAKYLNNFGYKTTLYVDDKKENTRQNMEILEYAPIFVDSSRFDQVVIFLAKEKLQWFMFQSSGVKLYNRDGMLLNDSQLQYSREQLLSILQELTKEDDNASLRLKFLEKLDESIIRFLIGELPRPQLISQEDRQKRSNIIFLFHKMFWQSKLMGKQTTIQHLKKFLKSNVQEQYLQSICGERLYMLKDCIKAYRHHLSQDIKWKDINEIKSINQSNERIVIDAKGKSLKYDYLICSHSNQFVSSIRDRFKQDDESLGSILLDNPGFSDNLIENFRCFEQLEQENITHYALLFNEIFWSKDAIFSLVGQSEDEKEVVFFLDGTSCNQIFGKQSSLLIAVMFIGRNDFRDKKQAQTFLLQSLGQCLLKSVSWMEQQLKELQVLHSSYFVPNSFSSPKKVLEECLNPVTNIFFNIPLQVGGWGDQLSSYMSNSLNIISRILKLSLADPNHVPTGNTIKLTKSLSVEPKLQLKTVSQMLAAKNYYITITPDKDPTSRTTIQDQNFTVDNSKFKFGPILTSTTTIQQQRLVKLQEQNDQISQNTNLKTEILIDRSCELELDPSEHQNDKQVNSDDFIVQKNMNGKKDPNLFKILGLEISETVQFNKFLIRLSNSAMTTDNLLLFYSQMELRKPLKYFQKSYIIQFGYTMELHKIKIRLKNKNDTLDIQLRPTIGIEQQLLMNLNFTSIVYFPSMFTKNHSVHYFFHKLYIDENSQSYFSLVPEDNQRVILFHQDLNSLWSFVQRRIHFINQPSQSNFINIQYKQKQALMTKFDLTFSQSIRERIIKNLDTQPQNLISLLDSYFRPDFFAPMDNKKIDDILLQSLNDLVHHSNNDDHSGLGGLFLGFHHPTTLLLQQISNQSNQSLSLDKLPTRLQNLLLMPTVNNRFPIQLLDFQVEPNQAAHFKYTRRFYSLDQQEYFEELYIEFKIEQKYNQEQEKFQEIEIFFCKYDSQQSFQEMRDLAISIGNKFSSIQKAFLQIYEGMKQHKRKLIYDIWYEFVHIENISYQCKSKALKILEGMLNKQDHMKNNLNYLGEQLSLIDLSLLNQNLRQLKNINNKFLHFVDGQLMFSYSLQDIQESGQTG